MDEKRTRDKDRTRAELLRVATEEFARVGFSGARVDQIAARTRTTKRMIYYYFGGKEQLYLAVLEQAYEDIRSVEQAMDLQNLGPVEALRTLAEFTFDYDDTHRDFIRLVAIENIHHAEYLQTSSQLVGLNSPVIALIQQILDRGKQQKVFSRDATAMEVHVMMSALCFFRVANRPTINAVFGYDMTAPAARKRHRRIVGDMLIAWLQA
ncbi:TetR family transcriptional regulator [Jatrophihabitans telluris]|uniref:TetR family transcriptional regulator n=1 Tax=Jatrophihabitans telluris TaxID=2038343 RepID=A0ABY4R2V0_9ACTN|nr:TetR/AcrR family transcriptional regulator [Jatrophihabitans telluris]UQX89743.1 TetR family transcriptional regulator [Jatrophihabitans telluris]